MHVHVHVRELTRSQACARIHQVWGVVQSYLVSSLVGLFYCLYRALFLTTSILFPHSHAPIHNRYIYIYIYTHTHTHTHTHTSNSHLPTDAYTHTHTHTHTQARTHTHTHKHHIQTRSLTPTRAYLGRWQEKSWRAHSSTAATCWWTLSTIVCS